MVIMGLQEGHAVAIKMEISRDYGREGTKGSLFFLFSSFPKSSSKSMMWIKSKGGLC